MATEEPTEEASQEPMVSTEEEEGSEEKRLFHCSECGSELTEVQTPTGTRYRCPTCQKLVRPIEKEPVGEREEEKGVPPLDVQARKAVAHELRTRLENVYGVSKDRVSAIADTVVDLPQVALNPTALFWHIKQLAPRSNDYQLYLFISGLFNKLREEGYLGGMETPWPIMGMPGVQTQQSQRFPFMFPQQQRQPFNQFMPFEQPPYQTSEQFEEYSQRVASMRRREEREQEEHELRMAKMRKEIESMGKPKETASDIVEIVEPMRDAEGNLMRDEKGNVVFRKVRGPADKIRGGTVEGDSELRWLEKAKKYQEIFAPKSELTEEKIEAIVQKNIPKEDVKPITERDVEDAARKVAQTVLARKDEEDLEERRHRELLDAVRQSRKSEVVEGYKSDSYRFMGQGMDRLADVIEKKQPIKLVVDLVKETPPSKEVEAGARGGLSERLGKEWVVEE